MPCPTCSHTMQQLGCCTDTGLKFFWCPRCGTLKPCDTEAAAPALVSFCRRYEQAVMIDGAPPTLNWERMGIAESINVPRERSYGQHLQADTESR